MFGFRCPRDRVQAVIEPAHGEATRLSRTSHAGHAAHARLEARLHAWAADLLEALHALALGWRCGRQVRGVGARALHGDVPVHADGSLVREAGGAALPGHALDLERGLAADVRAAPQRAAGLALVGTRV